MTETHGDRTEDVVLKITLHLMVLAVVTASGFAFGQQQSLADQIMAADEAQFAVLFPNLKEKAEVEVPVLIAELDRKLSPDADDGTKEKLARRQANAAVALLKLNQVEKVWPLLKHGPDPRARSYLIDRLGPFGVDPQILLDRLKEEREVSVKRAILLSLGGYGLDVLPVAESQRYLQWLMPIYRDDPDPGIHGAAEWLIRQWQAADKLKEIGKELATGKVDGQHQWYLNRQGQTMVIVPKPGAFWMGEGQERYQSRIDLDFAIASKEVTVDQFLQFRNQHQIFKRHAPTGDCPTNCVSWYDAAAYCNWLSEKEGIPKDQWCYERNNEGQYEAGMSMVSNYLQRTGYRLPTEAEWEYACRAAVETECSSRCSVEILGTYAWSSRNSLERSHAVGSLRPNDLGLFDMYGNVWEWTQDTWTEYDDDDKVKRNQQDNLRVNDRDDRVLRGGSFLYGSSSMRFTSRFVSPPTIRSFDFGFRIAYTLSVATPATSP